MEIAQTPIDHTEIVSAKSLEQEIRFIENAVQDELVDAAAGQAILAEAASLRKRAGDERLRLAVIGEFSSGKSTFINALLGDELLKISALPTTAAATLMQHGPFLTVELQFRDGRVFKAAGEDRLGFFKALQLAGALHGLPGALFRSDGVRAWAGCTPRQLIQLFTTNEKLSPLVQRVTITHPGSTFLAEGVLLIDTPGVNADNPLHGKVTLEVIEQEADAAIVIVPANIPWSLTLADFLVGQLRPFLHRCIFVVTYMDQVREREQEEFLTDLKRRLAVSLAMDDLRLLPCSARAVLDKITGEEPLPGHERWISRFEDLENSLVERTRRERRLILSERLVRLLGSLFTKMDEPLKAQWQVYHELQTTLEQKKYTDLNTFSQQKYQDSQSRLQQAASSAANAIGEQFDSHLNRVNQAVSELIMAAKNAEDLKIRVDTKLQSLINDKQPYLVTGIKHAMQKFSADVNAIGRFFDEEFSREYQELRVLGGGASAKTQVGLSIFQDVGGNVSLDASNLSSAMQFESEVITGAGAFLGAILGGLAGSESGANLGGLLGGILGSLFGPSLDDRKKKIFEQVSANYKKNLDGMFEKVMLSLNKNVQSAHDSLTRRIEKYLSVYQQRVQALIHQQEQTKNHLLQMQARAEQAMKHIERRQKVLYAAQQELKLLGGS